MTPLQFRLIYSFAGFSESGTLPGSVPVNPEIVPSAPDHRIKDIIIKQEPDENFTGACT